MKPPIHLVKLAWDRPSYYTVCQNEYREAEVSKGYGPTYDVGVARWVWDATTSAHEATCKDCLRAMRRESLLQSQWTPTKAREIVARLQGSDPDWTYTILDDEHGNGYSSIVAYKKVTDHYTTEYLCESKRVHLVATWLQANDATHLYKIMHDPHGINWYSHILVYDKDGQFLVR